LIVNTRIPIGREWRVNPRLQYDMRKLSDGRRQNKIRTLLRTNYRYQRNVRFDFEIGYDNTNESSSTGALSNNNLFYDLGYRYDF
jgi:maltoporin